MCVRTGISITEIGHYQISKLRKATSVFLPFVVQEAHIVGNAHYTAHMSLAAASILMNRKIISGTDSKGRQECDRKLVFNVVINVQILNFLLAFVS